MFPSLNIISVASGIMLIALHFLVNKEISQAKNPIEIQLNNKLVQTQNYSVSNHKYIFNSFSQTLPIVAKVKKDEFETTDEYNKRLQQAYTFFYGQLKSKGININNAYNIKINKKSTGNGGYKVSYDADKEIVTIRIEPGISLSNKYQDFLALEVESTSTTQYFQAGRGILKNILTEEYKLLIGNINSRREEILSFSLGRNEARKLISNNILGVAIVCKFIPPFVDEKSDFHSLFTGDNFVNRFTSDIYKAHTNVKDITYLTGTKYIIANAQKIVVYNTKNGKIYSEYPIIEQSSNTEKPFSITSNFPSRKLHLFNPDFSQRKRKKGSKTEKIYI